MSGEALLKLKDLSQNAAAQEEQSKPQSIHKKTKKKRSLIKRLSEIGTIKQKEVVEFTRHLTVMLSAGVTIFEAITFLKEQTKNKAFAGKLDHILENLNNGQSLSGAMKKYPKVFPNVYTNIIQVGEESGTLPETLDDLANHLEENDKFKTKVKGALIYPKIILTVMLIFIIVLFVWVMPRILVIFESLHADIPFATQVVIGITHFFENYIAFVIFGLAGLYLLAKTLIKNPTIRYYRDLFYIKVPLVGKIVLNYNTTQVNQHFGTLFQSGLTIVKCLEITSSVIKNTVLQREIEYMVEKIKNGSSLSNSFKEKSEFPPMFLKLIKVGERTGKLPHVIDYMKNYYKGLVDTDVKNITSIIEPVIMALLGLMVAGLVITVIGPIYQLISSIGK